MRSKTVKFRSAVAIHVTETVDVYTGRRVIEMRADTPDDDGTAYSLHEAEKLARALLEMVAVARRKAQRAAQPTKPGEGTP